MPVVILAYLIFGLHPIGMRAEPDRLYKYLLSAFASYRYAGRTRQVCKNDLGKFTLVFYEASDSDEAANFKENDDEKA
jgi:hypothetical protein